MTSDPTLTCVGSICQGATSVLQSQCTSNGGKVQNGICSFCKSNEVIQNNKCVIIDPTLTCVGTICQGATSVLQSQCTSNGGKVQDGACYFCNQNEAIQNNKCVSVDPTLSCVGTLCQGFTSVLQSQCISNGGKVQSGVCYICSNG